MVAEEQFGTYRDYEWDLSRGHRNRSRSQAGIAGIAGIGLMAL